jgi:hypothetical protein
LEQICLYLKNPKWQPKLKMPAYLRFLTAKSTEVPPTEQTLNLFWMQLIELTLKNILSPQNATSEIQDGGKIQKAPITKQILFLLPK